MKSLGSQYCELLSQLLLERELEGGLSDEVEEKYEDQLDRLWWAMTEDEQKLVEQELAKTEPPAGPADLGLEDRVVDEGAQLPPRVPCPTRR